MTVSYIGYKTVDLSATGQTFVKVVLQEDSKMIDEVVVVGYGVQSQKLVTTSISKVKMENIDQGNDYNPIKMLQGRVAGVNISSASGTPEKHRMLPFVVSVPLVGKLAALCGRWYPQRKISQLESK